MPDQPDTCPTWTPPEGPTSMEEGIALAVEKMILDYMEFCSRDEMKRRFISSIKIEQLQKWVKITADNGVKMFIVTAPNVERNGTSGLFEIGDILKPASYKAPTKNFARGNVFKPGGLKSIRWTGAV